MIYDVLVVGGGIAGLSGAIEAKIQSDNMKVAIITKGNIFKSNSSMASGGINAAISEQESEINSHIEDTINSAKGLVDIKAVEYLCKNAPRVVKKLDSYGANFDKEEERIAQRNFGGGSDKRTCFIGDKTGSSIIQALIKKAREVGVIFLPNIYVMNITTYKNQISGVICLRRVDSTVIVYPTKALILAGGGFAGIYKGFSTNSPDVCGDNLAVALRAGVNLQDMEFIQFHPTGFKRSGYLVSEAARGEGGYLVNDKGERFVDELSTRDIVSKEIANQIKQGNSVFIDLRHLSKEKIQKKLPSLFRSASLQEGIDITSELLPIKPVAHYTIGGIEANLVNTSIKGLFVSGEVASNLTHGANRLGGNSLLEGAVFGELAGIRAFEFAKNTSYLPIDYNDVIKDIELVDKIFEGDTTLNFNALKTTLGNVMFQNVGIERDYNSLIKAFDYIRYLRRQIHLLHCIDKGKNNNVELIAILELRNALEVAEVVIMSALKRKESRGSHIRSDFTTIKKEFDKHITVREFDKGFLKLEFKEKSFIGKLIQKLREVVINS